MSYVDVPKSAGHYWMKRGNVQTIVKVEQGTRSGFTVTIDGKAHALSRIRAEWFKLAEPKKWNQKPAAKKATTKKAAIKKPVAKKKK